tara:strand:- start:2458 stop:2670 length:213 start_codon:yes stop_codon:yes gene_type:complete
MLVSIQQLETISSDEIKSLMGKLQDIWMANFNVCPETLSYAQTERKAKIEAAIHNCESVLTDRHYRSLGL